MTVVKFLADALFVTRPMLWVPVLGFSLFGYLRGTASLGVSAVPARWPGVPGPVLGTLVLFACAVGCVYVLNQIADRRVDERNDGFAMLAHGNVPLVCAVVSAVVFGAAPVVYGLVVGNRWLAALSAAAVLVGALYSFPPTHFSGRPVLDFVTNAVGYGVIAFAMGWVCAGASVGVPMVAASLPYVLLMCAGSISSTLPDIAGDAASGKHTTAVVFGARTAHGLALALLCGSLLCSVFLRDLVCAVAGAAALPFYVAYAVRPVQSLMEATYKVGGGIAMVVVAVYVPVFAVVGVGVLLATLLYFRLRFGVSYPSLRPVDSHA